MYFILTIDGRVMGRDNFLTFIIGSQMELELAAALHCEYKSNLRRINAHLFSVLQGRGVKTLSPVLMSACKSSGKTALIASDSPNPL